MQHQVFTVWRLFISTKVASYKVKCVFVGHGLFDRFDGGGGRGVEEYDSILPDSVFYRRFFGGGLSDGHGEKNGRWRYAVDGFSLVSFVLKESGCSDGGSATVRVLGMSRVSLICSSDS